MANNLDVALRIQALVQGGASVEQLAEELSNMRIQALEAANAGLDLATSEGRAAQAANNAAIAAQRHATALANQAAAARAAATANPTSANQAAAAALEQQAQAAQQAANALGQQAAAANAAAQATQNMGQSANNSAQGVGQLVQAVQALAAAAVLNDFVKTAAAFESMEAALSQLNGSSADGSSEMEYVTKAAKQLGVAVLDAGRAYTSLTAATKGTQLEGQNTKAIFEAVSGAMAKLGKSSAETQNALTAIAQIAGKGTVSMEELRGQLGEALPGAMQAAARAMGVTVAQLNEMVSSGNVAADELLPKLAQELNNTFGTAPPDTINSALTDLSNKLDLAYKSFGETGSMDAFKVVLQAIGTTLEAVTITLSGAWEALELLGKGFGAWFAAIERAMSGDIVGAFDQFKADMQDAALAAADDINKVADSVIGVGEASARTKPIILESATAAQQLASSLEGAGKAGEKAGSDISAAIGKLNITTPQGVIDLVDALTLAGDKSALLEKGIAAWIEKANSSDLAAFSANIKAAFEGGQLEADKFAQFNDQILSASFKNLGLDINESLGRISPAVAESSTALQLLGTHLDALGTDKAQKIQIIEQAIAGMIDKAKNSTDIAVLAGHVENLGQEGEGAAGSVKRLTDEIDKQKAKIEASKVGVSSLSEEYKQFGITSLKSLQDAAASSAALYAEAVKAKAPIFEQQQAYAAMAKAQLAAAAAQGQAALQAKIVTLEATAQTKEQRAEVEKLKAQYQQLGQIPMPAPDPAPVVDGFQQAGSAATEFDKVMQGIAGANTQGQLNEASDNLNKSYSEGTITSAEYATGLGAVTDKAKDLRVEIASAATYLDGMTDSMKKATAQIWTQSTATAEIAENMRGMLDAVQSGNWDSATAELERNTVALEAQADAARKAADEWSHQFDILSRAGGADYISAVVAQAKMSEIMAEQAIAANELKIAQIQLGEAVDSLKAKAEDGNITLEQQRDQLVELQRQYPNLDRASLANLKSEIDSVNGKLLAMQEQAEATLNSLREEQARQSGNEAEATRLSNAEKIKKLEKDISEAQKAGNDEAVKSLREALTIQQQLNSAALKEAEARKKAADEAERAANAAPKTTTSPTTTTNTTTNSTKVVVEVSGGSGLSQLDQRALYDFARKLAPELNTLARRGMN